MLTRYFEISRKFTKKVVFEVRGRFVKFYEIPLMRSPFYFVRFFCVTDKYFHLTTFFIPNADGEKVVVKSV